ncbi:MAG: hypothetical protein HY872_15730 [Chloroflexi bacterium]|nr:hypothetical protein [Chloroflexota bacterium]
MKRIALTIFVCAVVVAACAPRQAVIETGVSATLTAMAPTSVLPAGRATSTPAPIVQPPTATPAASLAPTTDPQPSATEAATPAPAATQGAIGSPAPTTAPGLPALGAPIFADPFDVPGPWAVGDTDDSTVTVSGGVLTYIQKAPGSFSFRIIGRQGADYFTQVTTTLPRGCGAGDKFGLMFRVQDTDNYYVYMIDCDGRYRLARYGSGASTSVVDWTRSSAIKRGRNAVNKLAVLAKGNDLALYVNDTPLTTATESVYADGRFGLWVGSNVTNNLTVAFDDLEVYSLP